MNWCKQEYETGGGVKRSSMPLDKDHGNPFHIFKLRDSYRVKQDEPVDLRIWNSDG